LGRLNLFAWYISKKNTAGALFTGIFSGSAVTKQFNLLDKPLTQILANFFLRILLDPYRRKVRPHKKQTPRKRRRAKHYFLHRSCTNFYIKLFKLSYAFSNLTKFFSYNTQKGVWVFKSDFNKLKNRTTKKPFNWGTSGLKDKKIVKNLSLANFKFFFRRRRALIRFSPNRVLKS